MRTRFVCSVVVAADGAQGITFDAAAGTCEVPAAALPGVIRFTG